MIFKMKYLFENVVLPERKKSKIIINNKKEVKKNYCFFILSLNTYYFYILNIREKT